MGISLFRKPAEGGPPIIDANGHDLKEFLRVLPSFAARINATQLRIGILQKKKLDQYVVEGMVQLPPIIDIVGDTTVGDESAGFLYNRVDLGKPPILVGYVRGLIPPPAPPKKTEDSEDSNGSA